MSNSQVPGIINFKIKQGRDDDIILWLEALGERERSFYIRMALREWLQCKNLSPQIKSQNYSKKLPPLQQNYQKQDEKNIETFQEYSAEICEEELNKKLDNIDF